jgi:hypothetical protein
MTHGFRMPTYRMPRFHTPHYHMPRFRTVHSNHFGIGYSDHDKHYRIPCRHALHHTRQPADHHHFRPLTPHFSNLLHRLCFGGHGHAGR